MVDSKKPEPENKQSESELKNTQNELKNTENKDKNTTKTADSTADTKDKNSKKEDNKESDKEPPIITDEETIKHKKQYEKRKEYNRRYYAQRKNKTVAGEIIPKDTTNKDKEKTKKDTGIPPYKIALGIIGFVVSIVLLLIFIGNKSDTANSGNSSFTIQRE